MVTANRIRLTGLLRRSPRLSRASLCALVFVFAPPAPQAPVPASPAALARTLAETNSALEASIGLWTPKSAEPPREVLLYALYQQRIYRALGRDPRLPRRTLARVDAPLRNFSRELLVAHRELYRLTPPLSAQAIKVGRAPPAAS